MRQLYYANYILEVDGVVYGKNKDRSLLQPDVSSFAKSVYVESQETTEGGFDKSIAKLIASLAPEGSTIAQEYPISGGVVSVDIALMQEGQQNVAIEVNGLSHYTNNVPGRALWRDAIRKRLLEKLGWRVVFINLTQWTALSR